MQFSFHFHYGNESSGTNKKVPTVQIVAKCDVLSAGTLSQRLRAKRRRSLWKNALFGILQ